MDNKGRLWGMKCYLAGPMDRVPDGGVTWRANMTPFLQSLGIVVLDPCNKAIDAGIEEFEQRQHRQELKAADKYAEMAEEGGPIRPIDKRMVSIADFLIVNLDMDTFMCGTFEELFQANDENKPIFIRCKQGKRQCADWLFLTIPHHFIVSEWMDIKKTLCRIHTQELVNPVADRWVFFDYTKLMPTVDQESSFSFAEEFLAERE